MSCICIVFTTRNQGISDC